MCGLNSPRRQRLVKLFLGHFFDFIFGKDAVSHDKRAQFLQRFGFGVFHRGGHLVVFEKLLRILFHVFAQLLRIFGIAGNRDGDGLTLFALLRDNLPFDEIPRVCGKLQYQLRGFLRRLADECLAGDQDAAVIVQRRDGSNLVFVVHHKFNAGVNVHRHAGIGTLRRFFPFAAGGKRQRYSGKQKKAQDQG